MVRLDLPNDTRRIAAFAVVLATIHGIAAGEADAQDDVCVPDAATDVITRDDIERHTLGQLSDVFALTARWHAESIDGYHWNAAPPGLSSSTERWTVYVDDVPVTPRLLGRSQINALPVTVFDVQCIELVDGLNGRHPWFTRAGSMRIYTQEPDDGWSLAGAAAMGNEINDPGPFRYTLDHSPNVDRLGPTGRGSAAVNTGAWNVRATGRLDETHVTDDVLIRRVKRLYNVDPKPRIQSHSAGITASAGGPDRRHHLLAGYTSTSDIAYFPSIGLEVPTEHRMAILGASGRMNAGGVDLRYAASYVRGELGNRPNRRDVDFDWRQDGITLQAETRLGVIRIGGSLRVSDVHSGGEFSDPTLLTTGLFGGASTRVVPGWRHRFVVEWSGHGGRSGAAAHTTADVRIGENHEIRLGAGYGALPLDDRDLWFWVGRGYDLPVMDSAAIRPLGYEPLPRLLSADASWIGVVAPNVGVRLRSFYRRTTNGLTPVYDMAYHARSTGFQVDTRVEDLVAGSSAGGEAALRHEIGRQFRHRISYMFESDLLGDAAYTRDRERVPSHRIVYTAAWAPVDRFNLSTNVRYRSSTSWPYFEAASAESEDRYPWRLHERVLVDVSALKRMWKDHLTLSLALKNVLNAPVRFHPAGAVWNMALHFSIRLGIGSETGL